MSQILKNLPIGCYAVIFPSVSSGVDHEGHEEKLAELYQSIEKQDGYLGIESATVGDFKLAVAFFDSLEAIETWKRDRAHIAAKQKGRTTWLSDWQIRICKVEDIYGK